MVLNTTCFVSDYVLFSPSLCLYDSQVAEMPPFGKELLTCLTVCYLCIMFICNFGYFLFWFQGKEFGSDCISSLSLLTFYFPRNDSARFAPVFRVWLGRRLKLRGQ